MSDNGKMTTLYVFVLVLNLVFPVLGYTFTTFSSETERYEMELDPDDMMVIGLNLVDAESHNVTWEGGWVYFTLLNTTIRAQFSRHRIVGLVYQDGIRFQKQSAISKAFNSWLFPYTVEVKSVASNEWFVELRNETIERDWDTNFNWSRFVLQDGHHVFITPFETHGNISKAIWEDGTLNITTAKSFDQGTAFNFWSFIGWYGSLLIGDQSWGLPSVFSWVIRILGALSVFAVVMLTRELIGFT